MYVTTQNFFLSWRDTIFEKAVATKADINNSEHLDAISLQVVFLL